MKFQYFKIFNKKVKGLSGAMKTERMKSRSGGLEKFLNFFKGNNFLGLNFYKTILIGSAFSFMLSCAFISNGQNAHPTKTFHLSFENRKALRNVVVASKDSAIKIIEGDELIDHDPKYFDKIAVHPNDAGFKMMAERLAAVIPSSVKK
jgi:hypothetical protein